MVKGATPEERAAARAERRRRERRRYFKDEAKRARNGRDQVRHAFRFALAVAENEMSDAGRGELARQIVLTVERVAAGGGDGR
jgi:hypothetical protein